MPERGFDSGFWGDKWVRSKIPHSNYLFIYLWTNDHCNQAGVYEITVETMSFETRLPAAEIPELLKGMSQKVKWLPDQDIIWVKNFLKRQAKSPKFLIAAAKCLKNIKNNGLVAEVLEYNRVYHSISIPYAYAIDSVSIPPVSVSVSKSISSSSADKASLFSGDLFSLNELQAVLDQLPRGVDKLAQHEAIKQKLADFGGAKGYVARSEYKVRGSRVDLCWLTQRGEVVAAFEIDYRTPRDNSLEKLRRLGCPHAYILLRKGGLKFLPVEQIREEESNTPRSRLEAEETLCEGDQEIISVWRSVKGFDMAPADASALVARLRTEFPDVDILEQAKIWAARKLTEPLVKSSRPSQQIWNWMRLSRKYTYERSQREQSEGKRAKVHPREAYRGRSW